VGTRKQLNYDVMWYFEVQHVSVWIIDQIKGQIAYSKFNPKLPTVIVNAAFLLRIGGGRIIKNVKYKLTTFNSIINI
jgi:hypothetical protein